MSLTREAEPRVARLSGSRAGLLGAGESNPSGMLEMPVLFRMPDVAELGPVTAPKGATAAEPKHADAPVASPADAKPMREPAAPVVAAAREAAGAAPASGEPASRTAAAPATATRTLSKKAETWFDSHTKLLIVCFLVALTAVVYLARQKRRQNSPLNQPAPATTDWPDAQSGQATEPPPLSLETPSGKTSTAIPQPAAQQATTALHAVPVVDTGSSAPLAGNDSTAAAAPNDAALFPWRQPDNSLRTAARTTSEAPTPRPTSADPNQGPPVLPPVIPPAPSPTTSTSPRGYQYERTGSGLY